jgi:hypothetical protein
VEAGNRRLISILESQLREADSSAEGVGDQREQNHKSYTMQPLGNERPGRSRYISPDVLDSVEGKKALFIETFFCGRPVAKFVPDGYSSPQEADLKTAYANAQLRANNHFELYRDGWHDAFVAKRMAMLVEWKQMDERVTLEFSNTPVQMAHGMVQQALGTETVLDIDDSGLQTSPDPQNPTVSGTAVARVDRSRVNLTLLVPEQYRRDPKATYVRDAAFASYEEERSRGELVNDGYDPAQVLTLKRSAKARSSSEDAARKQHDASHSQRLTSSRAPEQEMVTFYRTWTWLDYKTVMDEMGSSDQPVTGIELFEIHWSEGEILRWADGTPAIRVADEMPFLEWCEYKISHAEHGMADADVLNHAQRVNSILKRLVLDNQQMRNSSRYQALYGAVKNPRDLLDNRIGGVIWATRQDAVKALETPELSPLTMHVMQMLKEDNEARSGLSGLSKGMNTDAIRYQNAADMVERLTAAGSRRVMKAARDFAESFHAPLMKLIVKLGKRHDKRVHVLQVRGQPAQVSPGQWIDRPEECEVDPALTPEAGQRKAQSLLMLDTAIKQDPMMAPMYTMAQRHALYDEVFDALGYPNSVRFLLPPDDPRVIAQIQQAQQQQQQQQQMQQAAFQLGVQEKQVAIQKEANAVQSETRRLELEQRRFELDAADKAADNLRADREFKWQQTTDIAEFKLEQEQGRAAAIGDGPGRIKGTSQ